MSTQRASLLLLGLLLFSAALPRATASPSPGPQQLLDPALSKAELVTRRDRAGERRQGHERRGALLSAERQAALEGLYSSQLNALVPVDLPSSDAGGKSAPPIAFGGRLAALSQNSAPMKPADRSAMTKRIGELIAWLGAIEGETARSETAVVRRIKAAVECLAAQLDAGNFAGADAIAADLRDWVMTGMFVGDATAAATAPQRHGEQPRAREAAAETAPTARTIDSKCADPRYKEWAKRAAKGNQEYRLWLDELRRGGQDLAALRLQAQTDFGAIVEALLSLQSQRAVRLEGLRCDLEARRARFSPALIADLEAQVVEAERSLTRAGLVAFAAVESKVRASSPLTLLWADVVGTHPGLARELSNARRRVASGLPNVRSHLFALTKSATASAAGKNELSALIGKIDGLIELLPSPPRAEPLGRRLEQAQDLLDQLWSEVLGAEVPRSALAAGVPGSGQK